MRLILVPQLSDHRPLRAQDIDRQALAQVAETEGFDQHDARCMKRQYAADLLLNSANIGPSSFWQGYVLTSIRFGLKGSRAFSLTFLVAASAVGLASTVPSAHAASVQAGRLQGKYATPSQDGEPPVMKFKFSADGTVTVQVAQVNAPMVLVYFIHGRTLTIKGEQDLVFTLLDGGDFVGEGMRFKREVPDPKPEARTCTGSLTECQGLLDDDDNRLKQTFVALMTANARDDVRAPLQRLVNFRKQRDQSCSADVLQRKHPDGDSDSIARAVIDCKIQQTDSFIWQVGQQ